MNKAFFPAIGLDNIAKWAAMSWAMEILFLEREIYC
jgi:hypothetical protein